VLISSLSEKDCKYKIFFKIENISPEIFYLFLPLMHLNGQFKRFSAAKGKLF